MESTNESSLDFKQKYFIAKSLYMQGMSINEIQKQTGIPPKTLDKWRLGMNAHGDYTSWAEQKAKAIADNAKDLMLSNKAKLVDIFTLGCDLIKRSLVARAMEEKPLDMKEARLVSEIITSLDKLNRLDSGKPTEIIEEAKPISLNELRDAVLKDKFINIIDVEAIPVGVTEPIGS